MPIYQLNMSKEVAIGLLKVAQNGNDLLSILDSLSDSIADTLSINQDEKVTPLAVDFVGDIVNF